MSLSVLGCVVTGPGEARETDIGLTGGGAGQHMVYLSGVTDHHVTSEAMLDHIVGVVEGKAAEIEPAKSGRAASRERVCQYVEISVCVESYKKKRSYRKRQ